MKTKTVAEQLLEIHPFPSSFMKRFLLFLSLWALLATVADAGESGMVPVYQVLDSLGEEGAKVVQVYCHDFHAQSTIPSFGLIAAPNLPPSNSPYPLQDHNILSASGVSIEVTSEDPLTITLDVRSVRVPLRFGISKNEVIRLAEQAIAETAQAWGIKKYKLAIRTASNAANNTP